MRVRAILSRTTTDKIKSKVLSPVLCELVFDCYMSPSEFAKLVDEHFDEELELEISQNA